MISRQALFIQLAFEEVVRQHHQTIKEVFGEDFNKTLKSFFTIAVNELESGKANVSLSLHTKYSYKNNHTNYASADRYFNTIIEENISLQDACNLARLSKEELNKYTKASKVIRFFVYEDDMDLI